MYMDIDNRFLTGYEVGNPPRWGLNVHNTPHQIVHNFRISKTCPNCKIVFETIYKDKIYCSAKCRVKFKHSKITKEGKMRRFKTLRGCEVCGFNFLQGLHIHHCTPKSKRKGQITDKIVLCANCHNILHHQLGWSTDFTQILTKKQSLEIINACYRDNGKDMPQIAKNGINLGG